MFIHVILCLTIHKNDGRLSFPALEEEHVPRWRYAAWPRRIMKIRDTYSLRWWWGDVWKWITTCWTILVSSVGSWVNTPIWDNRHQQIIIKIQSYYNPLVTHVNSKASIFALRIVWIFCPSQYLCYFFWEASEVSARIIIGPEWPQTSVFGGTTEGRCAKIGRWRRGSAGQTIIIVCYFFWNSNRDVTFFENELRIFWQKSLVQNSKPCCWSLSSLSNFRVSRVAIYHRTSTQRFAMCAFLSTTTSSLPVGRNEQIMREGLNVHETKLSYLTGNEEAITQQPVGANRMPEHFWNVGDWRCR